MALVLPVCYFYQISKIHFEWDTSKDVENQQKHGVSFLEAQYAFADPHRVIAEDTSHSECEDRFCCFGKVGDGVLTVDLHIEST